VKAYIIADVTVTDNTLYEEYKKLTPGSIEPFGGKFIVRGGSTEALEGDWQPGRIVVIEFPSVEKARAWWNSETYQKAKAIRRAASSGKILMVEGA
jgi:uncharacterized protein (DUF1330 family)